MTFETGVKGILRDIVSDNQTRNFNSTSNAFSPIASRTYIYDYNQDVYSAYATFGFTLAKKFGIRAGARYEGTEINGDARSAGAAASPFNENKNFRQNISGNGFTQSSNFSVPFRSFGMSFSYRFGKLSMQAPKKKRGVTNDDLKQVEQNNGNQ